MPSDESLKQGRNRSWLLIQPDDLFLEKGRNYSSGTLLP